MAANCNPDSSTYWRKPTTANAPYAWSCDPSKTCVSDYSGTYGSQGDCKADCVQKYSCKNFQCVEDDKGNFNSKSDCEANCTFNGARTFFLKDGAGNCPPDSVESSFRGNPACSVTCTTQTEDPDVLSCDKSNKDSKKGLVYSIENQNFRFNGTNIDGDKGFYETNNKNCYSTDSGANFWTKKNDPSNFSGCCPSSVESYEGFSYKKDDGKPNWVMISIIVAIIVLVVAVLLFFLMNKKKNKKFRW